MKLTKVKDLSLPAGVLGLAAAPDGARLYAAAMDGLLYECDADGASIRQCQPSSVV